MYNTPLKQFRFPSPKGGTPNAVILAPKLSNPTLKRGHSKGFSLSAFRFPLSVCLLLAARLLLAPTADARDYSIAGFYPAKDPGLRETFNFNADWKFVKRNEPEAWQADFDDSAWETVNLPHTLELLPENANTIYWYKGPSWYRKTFKLPDSLRNKKVSLYFEAVMQKCTVWVNGKELIKHEGGYLPVVIDISSTVRPDLNNVIAVCADNSDDPTFPIGRIEKGCDLCYFGGIYRDVWLIGTDPLHVTDPIQRNQVADGGVFIHSENIRDASADVVVRINIANEGKSPRSFTLHASASEPDGKPVAQAELAGKLQPGENQTFEQKLAVAQPKLWEPTHPNLYHVDSVIVENGKAVDGLQTRIGIRTIELRGKKFFLNGKETYLIGGNRHQDHAYVGNASPNSEQYRDANRLREASLVVFRSHYPQDPAFLDACDELGIFAINANPGWWYYTPDFGFPEKSIQNVRELIRLNRNRPSCFLWEIGLNETFYPSSFMVKAHAAAHEEYPYPGCFTAESPPLDNNCGGYMEHKDGKDVPNVRVPRELATTFPTDVSYKWAGTTPELQLVADKPFFGREGGDHVDNFSGQNGPGRVCRDWGEGPMLCQAAHYRDWLTGQSDNRRGFGSCFWIAFDHYRGYFNENGYHGIMDCYRLPKTSFYLFKSQNDADLKIPGVATGPMVYIANWLTPFSDRDITVYSNCEKVRLKLPDGTTLEGELENRHMKHPPVVFKEAFKWGKPEWQCPEASHKENGKVVAEGLINGQVVAQDTRQASARVRGIQLEVDDRGVPLSADGGDFVGVRAYFVDGLGNRRVLARNQVYFTVEGEGSVIGDESIQANPFASQFGSAVMFLKTTARPGKIKVTATTHNMGSQSITLESKAPSIPLLRGLVAGQQVGAASGKKEIRATGAEGGMSEADFERQSKVTPK